MSVMDVQMSAARRDAFAAVVKYVGLLLAAVLAALAVVLGG